MQSNGKQFAKNIFAILTSVKVNLGKSLWLDSDNCFARLAKKDDTRSQHLLQEHLELDQGCLLRPEFLSLDITGDENVHMCCKSGSSHLDMLISRYGQELLTRGQAETEGFKIDTTGKCHS